MIPITFYFKDGKLPNDRNAARKLKVQVLRFVQIGYVCTKWGFSLPYLMCLELDKASYVMREVHEGVCRNHSRARLLATNSYE